MKLVPFDEGRIHELCDLWNREIGESFPMREALFLQNTFRDKNVYQQGTWMAVEDNSIIGFVVAKRWQEQIEKLQLGDGAGWIHALLVRSDARGRGIGSALLSQAEQALWQAGAVQIYMGKDPWHYFPGPPQAFPDFRAWLERRGYALQYEVFDMIRSYNEAEPLTMPEFADGAYAETLHAGDQEDLLAFFHRCFPGRWYYEALKYWELGGTGREYVGLKHEGRIIGFCRVNDAKSPLIAQNVYWAPLLQEELGGIGPLGVDPEYRGKGYGLSLVQAGIDVQRQRGLRHIVIDWTELVDFYAKLGYQKWKGYDILGKQRENHL